MELADHWSSLNRFLIQSSQASTARIQDAFLLPVGAVHNNWELKVEIEGGPYSGEHEFVLRTDANSTIPLSCSRKEEFSILRAVHRAGVKVPEPLWLCEDQNLIGRSFYVMRKIPGISDPRDLVKRSSEKTKEQTLVGLGEELAKIHSVKSEQHALSFLRSPKQPVCLQRIEYFTEYLDQLEEAYPVVEWGLRCLKRNAREDDRIVLCHGDFRTGNYLVDDRGLSGIVDWELAHLGNPLEDFGYFCAKCWRFGAVEREAGGIGDRETLYQAYEKHSGQKVERSEVAYWELMGTVKWIIIALQQGQRYIQGHDNSLELALTNHLVPQLELDILEQIDPFISEEQP